MQNSFLFPVEEKEEEQIDIGWLSFHIKKKCFGSSKESEVTTVHLPCENIITLLWLLLKTWPTMGIK